MQCLDELIAFVCAHFPFEDDGRYPELKGSDEAARLRFALRHCVIHLSKSTGKIAAVMEAVDHGDPIDRKSLQVDVTKALVIILRLAELTGMDGKKIEEMMEGQYASE